jgi:hypothetical protein
MGHAKLLYYLIGSIVILAVEIDSDVGESLVDVLFLIKDISALIDLGDVELLNPVVDHCLAYVELLHELSQIVIVALIHLLTRMIKTLPIGTRIVKNILDVFSPDDCPIA